MYRAISFSVRKVGISGTIVSTDITGVNIVFKFLKTSIFKSG